MDCVEDDFIKAGNSIYLLPLFGDESGKRTLIKIKKSKGSVEEGIKDEVGKKWVSESMLRGLALQHSGLIKGRFRWVGLFSFSHTPSPLDDAESKRDCYHEFMQAMELAHQRQNLSVLKLYRMLNIQSHDMSLPSYKSCFQL
jgi:hypothetical protein